MATKKTTKPAKEATKTTRKAKATKTAAPAEKLSQMTEAERVLAEAGEGSTREPIGDFRGSQRGNPLSQTKPTVPDGAGNPKMWRKMPGIWGVRLFSSACNLLYCNILPQTAV